MFHKIDVNRWERKEYYDYYTQVLKVGYSVTVRLDVTHLLHEAKQAGKKFYPLLVYCVTKTVNEHKEFCMGVDGDGDVGYWDEMHPNYTIFHEDTMTFSDLWTLYDDDAEIFYHNMVSDIETYQDVHCFRPKENLPPNFYCISCVPWLDFEAVSTYVAGSTPQLFPIITMGKYTKNDSDRYSLSATMTISHGSADGYHTSKFFENVQKCMDNFSFFDF